MAAVISARIYHGLKTCACNRVVTKTAVRWRSAGSPNNILVETVGSVRIVRINRPAQRNCVNRATARELYQAFVEYEEDDEALVAVLAGEGGNFCAGYDLKELSTSDHADIPPFKFNGEAPMVKLNKFRIGEKYSFFCVLQGPSWLRLSKPVLAAVSGYAVAGGMELALWCDMRIGEEDCKMGVFCRRFGEQNISTTTQVMPLLTTILLLVYRSSSVGWWDR